MKMHIDSSKDIIRCRDILLKKMKIQQDKLKIARNKNSKDQNKYLENIRQINISLRKLENLLMKTAKFKTSEFVDFMSKFLTLTEGDFVSTKIVVEDEMYDKSESKKKNTYYMVSDKASSEFVKGHVKNEVGLTYFLDFDANEDVTLFGGKDVYPFNLSLDIKNMFYKYPKLIDAIYELIDLKLDNEQISDKERYEIVLNNTVIRNLNNSDNLSKKKS